MLSPKRPQSPRSGPFRPNDGKRDRTRVNVAELSQVVASTVGAFGYGVEDGEIPLDPFEVGRPDRGRCWCGRQ